MLKATFNTLFLVTNKFVFYKNLYFYFIIINHSTNFNFNQNYNIIALFSSLICGIY